MNSDPSSQRCAHKGCSCEVRAGQTYCGPHCANVVTQSTPSAEAGCKCGHADCVGHAASLHAVRAGATLA